MISWTAISCFHTNPMCEAILLIWSEICARHKYNPRKLTTKYDKNPGFLPLHSLYTSCRYCRQQTVIQTNSKFSSAHRRHHVYATRPETTSSKQTSAEQYWISEKKIYIVDLVKYIHIKEPKTLTISISLWAMTVRDYSASVHTVRKLRRQFQNFRCILDLWRFTRYSRNFIKLL